MRRAPLHAALLAIVLASIAEGCGSSGPPAVGQDFATRALAVCQHAYDLKHAQGPFPVASFNPTQPDPAKLAAVAEALRATDATWSTWLAEMQALGEPPSGQAAWDDLVAAVASHRDLNADQIAAALRGDTATFAADYDKGVATQAALLKAANSAGVSDGAKVDR